MREDNPVEGLASWLEDRPASRARLGVQGGIKWVLLAIVLAVSVLLLDQPLALWARRHPLPDIGYRQSPGTQPALFPVPREGDLGRELLWLEQWGQGTCTALVIFAVALLDRGTRAQGGAAEGRRRAVSLALACVSCAVLTHILKDVIGRSRPFVASLDGGWVWGGPMMGFMHGSSWGSFPSAHTAAAFTLSTGLACFYPRARILFFGLACITAGERVFHDAHYLSDVIAGMALGITCAHWVLRVRRTGRIIEFAPP